MISNMISNIKLFAMGIVHIIKWGTHCHLVYINIERGTSTSPWESIHILGTIVYYCV